MKFNDIRTICSNARINRYLKACGGDKRKTVMLYRYNICLCQRYFGIINMFEVMLRNAIHQHYSHYFSDDEWILHQTSSGQLLANDRKRILDAEIEFKRRGIYNSDRMVSAFTMGFWTYMFTKQEYRLGGKSLLQVFPMRTKGTTQKLVYKDLSQIREFRNRIAHHEPIVFNANGKIGTAYSSSIFILIRRYVTFMGYDPDYIFALSERPKDIVELIDKKF